MQIRLPIILNVGSPIKGHPVKKMGSGLAILHFEFYLFYYSTRLTARLAVA
jgi:hypothetical protein